MKKEHNKAPSHKTVTIGVSARICKECFAVLVLGGWSKKKRYEIMNLIPLYILWFH